MGSLPRMKPGGPPVQSIHDLVSSPIHLSTPAITATSPERRQVSQVEITARILLHDLELETAGTRLIAVFVNKRKLLTFKLLLTISAIGSHLTVGVDPVKCVCVVPS